MGLLKKKSTPPAPTQSTKLRALPDDDLYLFLESTLMGAQQKLADARKSDFLERPMQLESLNDLVNAARIGTQEMLSRL